MSFVIVAVVCLFANDHICMFRTFEASMAKPTYSTRL